MKIHSAIVELLRRDRQVDVVKLTGASLQFLFPTCLQLNIPVAVNVLEQSGNLHLTMQATCACETSVLIYNIARRHISKKSSCQNYVRFPYVEHEHFPESLSGLSLQEETHLIWFPQHGLHFRVGLKTRLFPQNVPVCAFHISIIIKAIYSHFCRLDAVVLGTNTFVWLPHTHTHTHTHARALWLPAFAYHFVGKFANFQIKYTSFSFQNEVRIWERERERERNGINGRKGMWERERRRVSCHVWLRETNNLCTHA
jgi:hypothetical protein